MAIYVLMMFLLALAVLAPRFGVDSRDGMDWWSAERRLRQR